MIAPENRYVPIFVPTNRERRQIAKVITLSPPRRREILTSNQKVVVKEHLNCVIGHIRFFTDHPTVLGGVSKLGHKKGHYSHIVPPIPTKLGTIITIYRTNNRVKTQRDTTNDLGVITL